MNDPGTEFRAALLTPPGRGAVAVIAFLADGSLLAQRARERSVPFFLAKNGRDCAEQAVNQIVYGLWGSEDVVLCRISESRYEVNCHGSPLAVGRILENLQALDVRTVTWQEWETAGTRETTSASLPDKPNPHSPEFVAELTRTRTFQTAEWLWSQSAVAGHFWNELEQLLDSNLPDNATLLTEFFPRLQAAAAWAEFGKHLTEPWEVVLGGLPNVGKSSLINKILGFERAIVFDQPGTTRDVVTAETALEGWPIRFSDTAGQRTSAGELEAAGIELAIAALDRADLPVIVIDTSQPRTPELELLLARFPHALLVANKSDLPQHHSWDSPTNRQKLENGQSHAISVSCITQAGLPELQHAIVQRLVPRLPEPDTLYPVTLRQRELLARALHCDAE